ncbi:MAG: CocE/NonD family hydrolase [Chitinophagales bacterium]
MKKFYSLLLACCAYFLSQGQIVPNGQLDNVQEFATKMTVPFVMPDGVKLFTDVYLPRVRDSLRVSLGTLDLGFTQIQTDTLTFIPLGAQIIFYDSINGQPNPDPYQLPTIFTRTPYDKGDFDELGGVLPILGYNYMLQDMRGRYSSEGVYFPMYSDSWNKNAYHPGIGHVLDYLPSTDPKHSNRHEDGYNSVKIIQDLTIPGLFDSLPHTNERVCNGTIGMFGASALGNTQLQLALAHRVPDSLPKLKSLMPVVATTEHYISTGYNNGVFRDRIVTGWLKGQIFSGTDDDLIPVDLDKQNSIHSSYDYDLPKTITLNGKTRDYQQNKFEAANLSIDHFTAIRYYRMDGTYSEAGFYPSSVGRPDMDGSVAPVNQYGEATDPVTQMPLPDLNYSRYTNCDLPVLHITGWWDIFTEGQINNLNYTQKAIPGSRNYQMQKMVIGPWAHQTIASRESGDRIYPKNVTDLTKFDLSEFDINNVPIADIVKSDLVTWFRYTLNRDSNNYVGEPKFIIRESHIWQRLGDGGVLGNIDVRVPSKDFIVSFVDMINFLGGKAGLPGLKIEVNNAIVGNLETTVDVPNLGAVLPQFGGPPLDNIPVPDFKNDVPTYRFYVPGPDSAADAAAGFPDNYKVGNFWFSSSKFPPDEHIQWQKMFLHQDGAANFTAPTQDEGFKMYVSDPDDPILTVGGSNMIVRSPDGTRNSQSQMELTDPTNAPFTMDREGVVQFNTEPFVDSFTIVGMPVCTVYAKTNPGGVTSGPTDCDWDVRICDVWPDGRVYFVQEGIVNARGRDWARALVDSMGYAGSATYVNGVEDPGDRFIPYTNIEIGQEYEYVFKMMPIGYTFAPGHKIRVLINSSNYTRYQANPQLPLNDGEFFRRKPGDGQSYIFQGQEMFPRVAVQRVHFAPNAPTSINFPVWNQDYHYNAVIPVTNPTFDATVFPNPASQKVQILVNMPGEHEVVITDITGRTVTTGRFDDNIVYDLSGFGKGLYFATITDVKNPNAKVTRKFIVQ